MNKVLFDLQNPVFDIICHHKTHNSTPRQQTAEHCIEIMVHNTNSTRPKHNLQRRYKNNKKVKKFQYTTYYTPPMQTKFVFQHRAMGRKEHWNNMSHTCRPTHNQNINTR
jgi:hypothetical protein